MTIDEAIFRADELKPNNIERARKIEWLSSLDRLIFVELMRTHEQDESTPASFDGYDQDTAPDTVLLASGPYEDLYRYNLEMHIDLVNQEYDKYNNSAALFGEIFGQYRRAYHREHRPLMRGIYHHF